VAIFFCENDVRFDWSIVSKMEHGCEKANRIAQLRSDCFEGVKFISADFARNSKMITYFDGGNKSVCDITVGLDKNEDIAFDFANKVIILSNLGVEMFLPIPDSLEHLNLAPVFPLRKPISIGFHPTSEHLTFEGNICLFLSKISWGELVILQGISCNDTSVLNALLSCFRKGAVPIVIYCKNTRDIPYSWVLDWSRAVVFVQEEALHVST